MPLYAKSLKRSAREAMRTAAPPAFLVTLIYLLLTQVLSEVVYTAVPDTSSALLFDQGGWMPLFLTILLAIYQTVMAFGYSCWALHTARGEQPGLGALMEGFGMVGRVLLMQVRIFLCVVGWTLLLAMGYIALIFPFFLLSGSMLGSAIVVLLSGVLSLAALGVAALPVLSQLTSLLQTGSFDSMLVLIQTAASGVLASAASMLISLPLKLFFQPYQRISIAHFYRALSFEQTAQTTME